MAANPYSLVGKITFQQFQVVAMPVDGGFVEVIYGLDMHGALWYKGVEGTWEMCLVPDDPHYAKKADDATL